MPSGEDKGNVNGTKNEFKDLNTFIQTELKDMKESVLHDMNEIDEVRIFWLCCCLLSWFGSALLIIASWQNFQNNAISFVTETLYGDWDTDFPSVSVCETDNDDRIDAVRSQIEKDKRTFDLDEVYKEITYFSGEANFIKNTCFEGNEINTDVKCPRGNFTSIAKHYRTPCVSVFTNCKWNNKPFNCCQYFLPLPTELGICYSINNIHTETPRPPLNMVSNRTTGPGSLYMELRVPSTVYVLAKQDVPSWNSMDRVRFKTKKGTFFHRWYHIKEVENEPEVREMTIKQRGCRFPDEGGLDVFQKYSYTGCLTQCRKDAQISLCNCSNHQTPNIKPEETCDLVGLNCINSNHMFLSVLRNRNSFKEALYCPCMLSCEDQELKDTYGTMDNMENNTLSAVEVTIQDLPSERFKRNVVRGKLDLVVSMGGTTGLFVGASLLSFVELVHYFTLRAYSTAKIQTAKNQNCKTAGKSTVTKRKMTFVPMDNPQLMHGALIPVTGVPETKLLRAQHSFGIVHHL
ncbi:sodium channel protein Nach [Anabrus simplex]|uniref:sodium channel protein Nach n=1 Tax=Anabrus simplex TaxID=316456 RepID=UPI0035A375C9